MPARIALQFVNRHAWKNARSFSVYHREGPSLGDTPHLLTVSPVALWPHPWLRAGFGHGRFGEGGFGWAQSEPGKEGGFGFGRFGSGEFGYYNPIIEWTTPRTYPDGLHTFGVRLVGCDGRSGEAVCTQTIFIRSSPTAPKALFLVQMSGGIVHLRWLPAVSC